MCNVEMYRDQRNSILDWTSDFVEPFAMVVVKVGAEAVIDGLLVVVEPVALVCGQHVHENGRCEDRAEG